MKETINYEYFLISLKNEDPPVFWPNALLALWHDGKGQWNESHEIAQEIPSHLGFWIHAYLHRKEGDRFNANYWYRRANRSYPKASLEEEFRDLVEYVLNNHTGNLV
jgi:hypothetical protein